MAINNENPSKTPDSPEAKLVRPTRLAQEPVPPLPQVDETNADRASVQYSHYRTGLSNHRTGLSEHRTSLSEYRTDLSTHRTDLSTDRTDMSMRRTGMSFQRTRLSAERTLMSVIRTSLSLIGFGFTIFQVFRKIYQSQVFQIDSEAPRNFGIALVALGIVMLVVGMVYHLQFMKGLRAERMAMISEGMVHGESAYPISMTLLTAGVLLLIGLLAIGSMVFGIAPFG